MTNIPIVKPAVRPVWASTAASSSIVDPDTQTTNFVANGWPLSGQPPTRQYFNWILNYCMNGVAYFNRRGIVDWDANETYYIYDVVIGPNGIVVQSLQSNNTNNNPLTSPGFWGALGGYATNGQLENSFVTTSQLNADLAAYVTTAALSADLGNYATIAFVDAAGGSALTQAEAYTNAALANYVTTSAFNSKIANYLTIASAENTYATFAFVDAAGGSALTQAEQYTQGQLANYVTAATFNQNIINLEVYANTVSNTALNNAVANTTAQVAASRGTFDDSANALFGNGMEMRLGYSPPNAPGGGARPVTFAAFTHAPVWGVAGAQSGFGTSYLEITGNGTATLGVGATTVGYYFIVIGY